MFLLSAFVDNKIFVLAFDSWNIVPTNGNYADTEIKKNSVSLIFNLFVEKSCDFVEILHFEICQITFLVFSNVLPSPLLAKTDSKDRVVNLVIAHSEIVACQTG